jgi:hypothetical protein
MLLLREAFPNFARELQHLLRQTGRPNLAEQVEALPIVDRCRCSDSFCGTFYTSPKPNGSYGPEHENVALEPDNGMVILDVVENQIRCVEVLYRDEIRSRLQSILP